MKIFISPKVRLAYPNLSVGILMAKVQVKKANAYVDQIKLKLAESKGIVSVKNYAAINLHPTIAAWRETYKKFGVKPKSYLSAVESLVKRVLKGQGIWNISDVVDLYNCVSVEAVIPMGAYDLAKINGDITLRYGDEGELFIPLGAKEEDAPITVKPSHVVYADETKILTWLWNNKDGQACGVSLDSEYVLFFADVAEPSELNEQVAEPIALLEQHLVKLGAEVLYKTVMDAENFCVELPEVKVALKPNDESSSSSSYTKATKASITFNAPSYQLAKTAAVRKEPEVIAQPGPST